MAERTGPGYGTPNWEMLGRWMELPAESDGPFWALNLMKYREVAAYGDGASDGRSGREADDRTFTSARFERATGSRVVDLVITSADGDAFVLGLEPEIDRVVESIQTAPAIEGPRP